MNKTKIEWCDYTWNPVVGCKHACYYCYAQRINQRFKMIPNWTKPKFFPERLTEPAKVQKSSKIFIGSMCDLFGNWVPKKWIDSVLEVCQALPRHEFMFLTKNPKRYLDYEVYPGNVWLGMTLSEGNTKELRNYVWHVHHTHWKKFVSIEPLRGDFSKFNFYPMTKIIVGAMTGPNPVVPRKQWIDSIISHNTFYKNNMKEYLGRR